MSGGIVLQVKNFITNAKMTLAGTLGSMHVYALAKNMVRVSNGTYDATEILGYRVLVPGSGTLTLSPVGGVADIVLTTVEVNAMGFDVFPEHLDSIELGNGDMEILVYIP